MLGVAAGFGLQVGTAGPWPRQVRFRRRSLRRGPGGPPRTRPAATGLGLGVQSGHSRGLSARSLIARSRSLVPSQVRARCQVMPRSLTTSIKRAPRALAVSLQAGGEIRRPPEVIAGVDPSTGWSKCRR